MRMKKGKQLIKVICRGGWFQIYLYIDDKLVDKYDEKQLGYHEIMAKYKKLGFEWMG